MPAALVTSGFRPFCMMIDPRDKTAGVASFAKIDAAKGAHD
jgi:hypothetical protein